MNVTSEEAHKLRVLVYGESLIDIVHQSGSIVETPGGSPANVALGLGRLGVGVALLTAVGSDDRGRRITERLEASGVVVLPGSTTSAPTSTATAVIDAHGHADYRFDLTWDPVPPAIADPPDLLHTGSIAAFLSPGANLVLEAMRQMTGAEVTFDPNIRPALIGDRARALSPFHEAARLATVIKLSDEDAKWLYPDASLEETIHELLRRGPRVVALTRGSEGAIMATKNTTVSVPGHHVKVADTIGAGDTFTASLIASLLQTPSDRFTETTLREAGRRAVRAAAITVSRPGADPPYRHELDDLTIRSA